LWAWQPLKVDPYFSARTNFCAHWKMGQPWEAVTPTIFTWFQKSFGFVIFQVFPIECLYYYLRTLSSKKWFLPRFSAACPSVQRHTVGQKGVGAVFKSFFRWKRFKKKLMQSTNKSPKITKKNWFWNRAKIVGVTASQSWPLFQCAHKCAFFPKNANFKTVFLSSYTTDLYVFDFIWKAC